MQSLKVVFRSYLGFICIILSSPMAASPPDTAPRRAGPSGLTSDRRLGIGVQTRSMAPVQEDQTVSAIQNQNSGSGTSTRLRAIARVCSNVRFRYSPLCGSSCGSFCKSFRSSFGGPPTEITSSSATGAKHTRSLSTRAVISLHAVWNLCLPAAFRLRNKHQQQQSSNASAAQTLGSGRSGAKPPREEIAHSGPALWAPSMAERDIILEALAEFPGPSETTSARWPGAASEHHLSPTQPVVRRSETGLPRPPP